jgi:16S rRNA pseudouridine516 synthase
MADYRLDRLLAEAAQMTRTQARRAITMGRVTVDGQPCRRPEQKIAPKAALVLDGSPLCWQQYVYLMLHKPQGVVSASRDAKDVTVTDLVKGDYPRRTLFPAGRLDKDSTGFVLLTDDGALAHDLLAPRRHVDKTYFVKVDTPVTKAMEQGFIQGVTLADGKRMLPAELLPDAKDPFAATVVLHQGVYHQIKRMFGVFDAGVVALHRVAIGGVVLDAALAPGASRPLTQSELALLQKAVQK